MDTTITARPTTRTGATMLAKVPAVTALFWVVKLLTTGMGEALADYLGVAAPIVLAIGGGAAFIAAMTWQLRSDRYRAVTYWSAVSMVAVFGTVLADGVRIALGVSLPVETGLYLIALLGCLAWWRAREGTLSIHTIDSRGRETFYWVTVMLSFALGTAAGDLTAFFLGWGFLVSIGLFAIGMAVPLGLYRTRLIGEVAAFWSAYVLTRPLGASVADWLGKPTFIGGIGLGDGVVAGCAIAVIALLVAYLARARNDVQPTAPHAAIQPVETGTALD